MDAREERRHALAREVSKTLRTPAFREFLKPFGEDNKSHPVVVALPDDLIGEVFRRIERHYHDGANVITRTEDGNLANIIVTHEGARGEFGTQEDDALLHVRSEIGMLLAVLRYSGRALRCRSIDPEYRLGLLHDGDKLPV